MSHPSVPEPDTMNGCAVVDWTTLRTISIVSPKTGIKLASTWEVAGVLIAANTFSSNSMGPKKQER